MTEREVKELLNNKIRFALMGLGVADRVPAFVDGLYDKLAKEGVLVVDEERKTLQS